MTVKTDTTPRFGKQLKAANKDGRITRNEAKRIENAASADVRSSKTPRRTAQGISGTLKIVASGHGTKLDKGVAQKLEQTAFNVEFTGHNIASEREGKKTAALIKREFTRDDGANLGLMGHPWSSVDPKTIRWGDADGGTITLGFNKKTLPRGFHKPGALEDAVSKLPAQLRKLGYDEKTVKNFEYHLLPYVIDNR